MTFGLKSGIYIGFALLAVLLLSACGSAPCKLGRDHFLLDDQVDAATVVLALTVIRHSEQGGRNLTLVPEDEALP